MSFSCQYFFFFCNYRASNLSSILVISLKANTWFPKTRPHSKSLKAFTLQNTAKEFRDPPNIAAIEDRGAKEVVFRGSGTASSGASGGFAEVRAARVFARSPVAMDALDKVL